MAMPRFAGGTALTSVSSILTLPEVASSSPAMTRSKVDFPQPEGPTKTTNSPSFTSRSMPFSTSTLPKDFLMFSSFSEPTGSSFARQTRVAEPLRRRMPTSLAFQLSQPHRLAGAHAFVGSKADGERAHGVLHVTGEVDIPA